MNAGGFRLLAVLLLVLAFALPAQAKTMPYPTADDARYLIDVPDGWEAESAEEMGGFMNITGPSGALISLRFLPAGEYTVPELMKEAVEFMQENYTDVRLTTPESQDDMHRNGAIAKSDGVEMVLANSWLAGPDVVIEVRIAAEPQDGASVEEGMKIMQTMRPGK